jgi:hypothetical protein
MRKVLFLSVLLLLAACGGHRIELNNGSGMDLETVTVTIGENSETFHNIAADEIFGTDIAISDAAQPVRIDWETGGETWFMEYTLIDRAAEAKRISILFAPDEVSVNYSF